MSLWGGLPGPVRKLCWLAVKTVFSWLPLDQEVEFSSITMIIMDRTSETVKLMFALIRVGNGVSSQQYNSTAASNRRPQAQYCLPK